MRIIKQGSESYMKKPKTFTCKNCGCVCEADKDEYKVCDNDEYCCYIKCPFCGETVTADYGIMAVLNSLKPGSDVN